ncbi:hypothetical protein TWF718_005772 [Orbilia javanica]|uniref:Uncharacterized protein n=1 Tax=Orbilia javanica TaxID=47235 RepID=A0AAN8RP57_9PEZI
MPRRGLLRQAKNFGVFDRPGKQVSTQRPLPLPALPPQDQPQPIPQAPGPIATAAPNPDNLAEMLEGIMPGAFPQFQLDGQPPAALPVVNAQPIPQPALPNPPIPPRTLFFRRESRLRRILNHLCSQNHVPHDFYAPQMSWTEVRSKLYTPPEPAPNPAKALYDWDRIRYRIGLQPTFDYVRVEQQQQQSRFQAQARIKFPPGLAQPQCTTTTGVPAPAAEQPANSPYMLVNTPQGLVYIPQPPEPGAENPFTGQLTENPWSQQDVKSLATVLFLSGMKLTWNAATSMWNAATAAYNQNFDDQVKLRDQTNQWINECMGRGLFIPVQRQHQQYVQPLQWPQWERVGAQQPQPIPQHQPPQRWC